MSSHELTAMAMIREIHALDPGRVATVKVTWDKINSDTVPLVEATFFPVQNGNTYDPPKLERKP